MPSDIIQTLACDTSDPKLRQVLGQIARIRSLALPPLCLPDVHLKTLTEGPSSFIAATIDTLVPDLTAPSVGCGIAVAATNLSRKNLPPNFFEDFFRALRSELGPNYGTFRNLLLLLGIIKRPHKKYDLTDNELEAVLKDGARAAQQKYNLPEDILPNIEYRGSMFSEEEKRSLRLKETLPPISFRSGKHNIGYGFKGNHFIEIQYVEEIVDIEAAEKAGLFKDQVVIMYHGGGGAVPYHVGRFYGHRLKNTRKQKFLLFILKLLFHFGSWEGVKNFRARWRYYFAPETFQEIPVKSAEGRRLLEATKAALNYSYAFRVATFARAQDALKKALGGKNPKLHLVADAIHNSIINETLKNKEMFVHRHTANRVWPGELMIISGYNNTSSYLTMGLPGADKLLFSADHGAGETIKRIRAEGGSTLHPQHFKTLFYKGNKFARTEVEHITDEGIDLVIRELEKAQAIKPVARLRPMAVFKG